jgi:hypothetical protein
LKALEHELETNWGDHKTEQKFLTEMKSQIRQHEEWVGNRTDNQEEHALMTTKFAEARKHLEVAEKAHKALLDHASENEYFHNTYLEQESHRRRADARTKRLAQALDSSQRGIEHWQKHIDEGFDQLLTNSKRVENGEPSSHARRRQQKSPEKKKQSPSSRNKKKQQPRGEEE